MKYVEVVLDDSSTRTVATIAGKARAVDLRVGPVGPDGLRTTRLLVGDDELQFVLDALQSALGAQPGARIVVLAVETILPQPDEAKRRKEDAAIAAREALYESVERSAQLDLNFLMLVILSTVVAAIGLIEDNVAVVIGAMVIAPLLGPNLALSLATALGDTVLMHKAVRTLIVGIAVAVALAAGVGMLWPEPTASRELLSRTESGVDAVVLALASGTAAALSLTTGLSSVLMGVMVAVALLPPAATLGIMLGDGNLAAAMGAGLLLLINIVCVNLASKLVFYLKGIHPRTWVAKESARRAMRVYVIGWIVTLVILVMIIHARSSFRM
ncbi:TIGR00341 family protein [Methylolobus aquaticus]|nr:TIGR00341 family protein [Methylolobus aquaticus]